MAETLSLQEAQAQRLSEALGFGRAAAPDIQHHTVNSLPELVVLILLAHQQDKHLMDYFFHSYSFCK